MSISKLTKVSVRYKSKDHIKHDHCAQPIHLERTVNALATTLGLVVAKSQYNIDIRAVWGISAHYRTKLDDAIFNKDYSVYTRVPRDDLDWHIDQMTRAPETTRRPRMADRIARTRMVCERLSGLLDCRANDAHQNMDNWFTISHLYMPSLSHPSARVTGDETLTGNMVRKNSSTIWQRKRIQTPKTQEF